MKLKLGKQYFHMFKVKHNQEYKEQSEEYNYWVPQRKVGQVNARLVSNKIAPRLGIVACINVSLRWKEGRQNLLNNNRIKTQKGILYSEEVLVVLLDCLCDIFELSFLNLALLLVKNLFGNGLFNEVLLFNSMFSCSSNQRLGEFTKFANQKFTQFNKFSAANFQKVLQYIESLYCKLEAEAKYHQY